VYKDYFSPFFTAVSHPIFKIYSIIKTISSIKTSSFFKKTYIVPKSCVFMAQNFCPNCGAELKYSEAEICPTCGVRIKEQPSRTVGEQGYEPNNLLIILFVAGLLSIFFAIISVFAVISTIMIVILSAIMVYIDAKSIGEDGGGAALAFIGVLLLWIIVLPIYLLTRKGEYLKNLKKRTSNN